MSDDPRVEAAARALCAEWYEETGVIDVMWECHTEPERETLRRFVRMVIAALDAFPAEARAERPGQYASARRPVSFSVDVEHLDTWNRAELEAIVYDLAADIDGYDYTANEWTCCHLAASAGGAEHYSGCAVGRMQAYVAAHPRTSGRPAPR